MRPHINSRSRFQLPMLALGLSVLLLSGAAAQAPPALPPAYASLLALAGEFKGQARMTMDGKTVEFTLYHSNTRVAGGRGLLAVEKGDVPGMGRYNGSNLFGYDAGSDMLHLFSVTSDGSTHDHRGHFDGKSATLVYEGRSDDGQSFEEQIPLTITSKDEYSFTSEVKIGGKVAATFEASMKRVK